MKDIYAKSKTGFKWTLSGNLIKGGIGFLTLLFLTYYLGPEKLGIISILTVIYGLSEMFVQFGISQSIIARDKNTDKELSSIFWTNLGVGLFIFFIINLTAGPLSFFYDQPELEFFIRVLSFVFIVEPLDLVFRAILQKELRFSTLQKTNIFRSLVSFVGVVVLVLLGFDVLGYVMALILSVIASTLIFVYVFLRENIWFPQFHFSMSDIKGHYKFGFYVTAKSLLNYAGRNFDELIVGKILGLEALGFYYFAKKVAGKPTKLISVSLSQVSFPLYCRMKNSIESLRKTYLFLTHFTVSIWGFLFGAFFVCAPMAIPLLFGKQWEAAIILVQLFLVISFFDLLGAGFGSGILYAFRKPRDLFKMELFVTPIRLVLVFLASLVSIESVIIVFLLSVMLKVSLVQNLSNRLLEMDFRKYFSELSIPVQNIAISLIVVLLVIPGVVGFTYLENPILPVTVYFFLYLCLFYYRDRGFLSLIKNFANYK